MSLPTFDETKASPLFKQLSDKEQKFLEKYLQSGGDAVEAALAAYTCKNDDSARAIARQVLGRSLVQSLLSPEESKELSIEEACLLLSEIARDSRARPNDRVSAINEIGVLKGWRTRHAQNKNADAENNKILDELDD